MSTKQIERFALDDDYVVEIDRHNNDTWNLAFSDGSGAPLPLDLSALFVEASSSDQKVRGLKLGSGDGPGRVLASGWVEFATHARIALITAAGRLERQYRFGDAAPVRPDTGPAGGSYADMGHGAGIELTAGDTADWRLKFYLDGKEQLAPLAELITVQVIDEQGRVMVFSTKMTDDPTALAAAICGSPSRIRLVWSHGDHSHSREFDLG